MCSEALFELEESLAGLSSSNELLLNNLELKADLNRFAATTPLACLASFTEHDLIQVFRGYEYANDSVATCPTCRSSLDSSSSCCTEYVDQQRQGPSSSLERDYWALFLQNPYKTILTLPNYTKMVFFQMGIPFQLRELVWQKLLLVNQKNSYELPAEASMIYTNFQHSYNYQISKQIEKDLGRTFPDVAFFKEPETVNALLTILNVYANYDLELGYCQGLLFLVGTLYQLLRSRELTFHAMCKIMECEPQLRSIYVPVLMLDTLERWRHEFSVVFSRVDAQLYTHLTSFCDMSVFLFQWWLSNNLIHAPDLTVNHRIVECCLAEGWKVGNFKVSLGVLLRNRPILMSFGSGDEDVVYQHLLNESKWGNIINSTTSFFGDLLHSWDEELFMGTDDLIVSASTACKRTLSERNSIFSKFKNLSIGTLLLPESALEYIHRLDNRSLSSVFSGKDNNSVYSQSTDDCSDSFSKEPPRNHSFCEDSSYRSGLDDVILENQALRFLLKKAYNSLEDESLKKEIGEMLEMV